nr:D-alanyl-D-alanine carboxypeptidase family protein [Acidisphaera sp. L21]
MMPTKQAAAQVGSARYASMVMDAASGQVLSAANADEPRYPASLTKMMTIYMLFEALRDRRVSLTELVPVSPHAASMPPSKLGLVPGTSITVEQALFGLVTKSANDAASALGELMGGDEDRFAQMMTLRARALGMSRTTFRNASGLPDLEQTTTARDLALLARHLIQDYPQEYHYFSVPSFVFHGRVIPNHDRMLQTYPGADGLKTGYIDASGCNLVTSAVRGDVRMIGVVLGAQNGWERDTHMASLLDAGFERMGVPITHEEPRRPRSQGLIAAASAATLPASSMPPTWHRGARPVVHYAGARTFVREREAEMPMRAMPRGGERRAAPARLQPVRVQESERRVRNRPEPELRPLVRPSRNGRSTASTSQAHPRG